MNNKTFAFYLIAFAGILLLAGFSSASQTIVNATSIQVNGLETYANSNSTFYNVSIIGGTTIPVTVAFTANANESNVRMSVELQGVNNDVQNEIFVGDVEQGQAYIESLTLNVPQNIGDISSTNLNLVVTVWNGDSSVSQSQYIIPLREQRQSYNVGMMSLNTESSANAGDLVPVNVVLQNTGYNNLSNLYVIVSIPALNIQRTAYFGDLQNSANGNDTASGTIYLPIPYTVAPGAYSIQAEVKNSYIDLTSATTLSISNQFQSNLVADNYSLSSNVGQDAVYYLELVNPTNNINLYSIVPQNISGLAISSDSVVTVPAGSSRTITVTANPSSSGEHDFNVSVFSGGQMTGSVALSLDAQSGISNPVVVLTIILAVIFVALLVVLIMLVAKKPSEPGNKAEEFKESYY